MIEAYIYDAVRTPRGKGRDGGALNDISPLELQRQLIQCLPDRTGIDLKTIDDIILGCVTQVGEQGGNVAKVSALYSGLPDHVSGITINRYCTSGLDACNFGAMKIMSNVDDLVLAGGVESMSRVAMLSDKATFYTDPDVIKRTGFVPMGLAADLVASLDGITREECDDYAVRSQQRAATAQTKGHFSKSLIPIETGENGQKVSLDESIRTTVTPEKLGMFDPIFSEFGKKGYETALKSAFPELDELRYIHHPGNSPGIVDGASLVVIGSAGAGKKYGLTPRAKIHTMTNVCSNKLIALTGGIDAAIDALNKADMSSGDVDLIEFNEAFASVSIKFIQDTDWTEDQVNVNGGAIALGHAMGATGASLVGTVLDELERRDFSVGMVAISGAAGIGTATIVERV